VLTKTSTADYATQWAAATGGVPNVAWTDYVPTFTGWTLGNATYLARYARVGRTIFYEAVITLGSTTTKSGQLSVALPVPALEESVMLAGSDCLSHKVGFSNYPGKSNFTTTTLAGATAISPGCTMVGATPPVAATVGAITPTQPFTWVTGDRLVLSGFYEAAS